MAGKGMTFEWDPTELITNLKLLPSRVDGLVEEAVKYNAAAGEAYMKKSAKWKDRTGNARNGLTGISTSRPRHHEINYFHSVGYGIWLEIRFAGRYAIIGPTTQKYGDKTMQMLEKGMTRLGRTA